MTVTALLFARLREVGGGHRFTVEVDEGATVGDLYGRLAAEHSGLADARGVVRAVRNQETAAWSDPLADGDEVAFLPPVSGGADGVMQVEVGSAPLDARRLEAAVATAGAGGICTFTGVVRDNFDGRPTRRLEYEAYAGLAETQMREIAAEIVRRWPGARVAMAHRTGRLEIGEASVVISVSCPHRAEAFEACRYGIDTLKESVAIWKKEIFSDGAEWVEGPDRHPA